MAYNWCLTRDCFFLRTTGAGAGGASGELSLETRVGLESEAGVILKINLSNFMCHRRFEINLCK